MHRNLTPHTTMHRNRHFSGKCTDMLPLTHECTDIIIPQVNAPESYPSHMNAPQIVTPQVNEPISYPSHMNARHHHPSSKCTGILPLTHECTKHRYSSGKCCDILPLTHECTEIIISQVNAPESYPSQMNAQKSSSLR